MQITIKITTSRLPEDELSLTDDLRDSLSRIREIELVEPIGVARQKVRSADPLILGAIFISILSTRAIEQLVACLRSYLERDDSLQITLKSPNGMSLSIKGPRDSSRLLSQLLVQLKTEEALEVNKNKENR